MKDKISKFLLSSDGENVSLRIKSAAGFIVLLLGFIGFQTDQVEIGVLADNIGQIITGVGLIWTASLQVKGWMKAVYIKKYGVIAYKKSLE